MGREKSPEVGRHLIATEGNFEELPLGRLNAGGTDNRSLSYEWSETYTDEAGGIRSVARRWVVTGNEEYGLPGEKEQDVYVAILELISQRGGVPDNGVISFSLYELLEIMGIKHGGNAYLRLRKSLRTISRSTIESHRAFYSEVLNKYISDEFQMFTIRWAELETPEGNRVADLHHLLLHPYFVESYNENYCGRLDAEFYWSLKRSTTKRLYRLLDRNAAEKRDGGARSWEVGLYELVGLMPLSTSTPANIMRVLDKAHEELAEREFLDRAEYVELSRYRGRKVVQVRYRLSKKFAKRTFSKRIDLDVGQQAAVDQMCYWGLSRVAAVEFVLKRGVAHCERVANLMHFQPNVKPGVSGGLLRRALEEEYDYWEENARKSIERGVGLGGIPPEALDTVKSFLGSPKKVPEDDSKNSGPRSGNEDPGDVTRMDPAAPAPPATDAKADVIWQQVLNVFEREWSTLSTRMWFEGTVPVSLEGSSLCISVPNPFAKEYIGEKFRDSLERSLSEVLGVDDVSDVSLVIEVWGRS